ncbi:TPA: hypothetical protein ACH3X3_003641 [Trebouxia sp. C0006]
MSIYFISKLPLPNGAHHWIGPLHYHKALPSWPVHHPTEQCRWALTCYRQLTPCPKAIHNRIRVYCSLAMYVELHIPVTYIVTDVSMTIAIVKSLWIASSIAVLKTLTLLWHDAQIATVMQIAHIAYAGMTKSSINTEIQTNFAGDNHTSCDSAAYGFSCTCVLN